MKFNIAKINNTNLLFSPMPGLQTASIGIFLKNGARSEPKYLKGIAHFFEHMLFKGTKNYSHRQITREIEGRGGALNGFTAQEMAGYYAHFLNKNVKETLAILIDMVKSPSLEEKEIEKERNVILEEIRMYNDIPSSRVVMLLDQLLWPNHVLGEEIFGSAETVKRIQQKDLISFKNKYYQPSEMVVSCVGDVDFKTIYDLIKKEFPLNRYKSLTQESIPKPLEGIHICIEKRKLEQVQLCFAVRGVSYRDKDKFTIELLHIILGANMSSRLFESLRERQALSYDVSTEVRKYQDSGAFIVHLGLDKSNVILAIKDIFKQLQKVKESQISLKELSRAKDYMLGHFIMGLEQPQGRMFYLAESMVTVGKFYSLSQIRQHIVKVSVNDLKRCAERIFSFKNICVACVGDIDSHLEKEIYSLCKRV